MSKKRRYENVPMFDRVQYSNLSGRPRPHLELSFRNKDSEKIHKTFALVDSGADHTVIPYSVGISIGLQPPSEAESLGIAQGVGGQQSWLARPCQILVPNKLKKEVYTFEEEVWWIYPDQTAQSQLAALMEKFKAHHQLQQDAKDGTRLHAHFEAEKGAVLKDISQLYDGLETGVLLGRSFFRNFEHIQFLQSEGDEHESYFHYKVRKHMAAAVDPISDESAPSKEQVAAMLTAAVA